MRPRQVKPRIRLVWPHRQKRPLGFNEAAASKAADPTIRSPFGHFRISFNEAAASKAADPMLIWCGKNLLGQASMRPRQVKPRIRSCCTSTPAVM